MRPPPHRFGQAIESVDLWRMGSGIRRVTRSLSAPGRSILLFLALGTAAPWQAPRVRVKVSESTIGTTTYVYRVENGSNQPIVGLRIGIDRETGQPELRTAPVGWTLEHGLPASSAKAPSGWAARVVTTEESDLLDLAWSSDGGPQGDIGPGTTSNGFSVKVAHPAAEYRTSHFEVTLGNATRISGVLEPDTNAPASPRRR